MWEKYSSFFDGNFYDYSYYELIRDILKDAYLEDPNRAIGMMNYIIKEELTIQEEHLFENYPGLNGFLSKEISPSPIKSSKSVNKNLSKKALKVFISYSMKDKRVGAKIKEMLENFGIECFMAHDDIGVSEEWKKRILNELGQADIFIPILSSNFRNSDWCSQEAGIACFRDILFIPLSLDKEIKPYGFMSHRQGQKINEHRNIPLNYLIDPIMANFPEIFREINIIEGLINELEKVRSFNKANKAMDNLKPYFNKLSADQANRIVDISIANDQIWQAFVCQDEYLPNFIKINKDKIEEKKLKELIELIK